MLSWKGLVRINIQLPSLHRTPQELHHVSESIVQIILELCLAWGCDHSPWKSVSVSSHPLLTKRQVALEEAAALQAPQTGSLLAGGPQRDKKVGGCHLCISDTSVASVAFV